METGDRKLNEVKKVTDMAYVPVIMADGSVGQIAKSDLASVVAGILNPGYVNKFNVKPSENGYVKLYTTKANGNSCALITLHRYNNRPMAVICVYLHPERTDDTLVCKYIIGEKNSTSYDLNLYYTANSDGSYSIYSTHTYFYPSSVSFLLNHNTIVNNEAISSLPSGATEANIVHDVFGYNSLAELSGGVAGMLGNPVGTKGYIENVYPNISSYDEVVSSGIYTVSDSVSVSPKNGVLVVNASSAVVCQTFYEQNGVNQSRLRWYGNWTDWQRIDNFGYNTLEELAAALKPLM